MAGVQPLRLHGAVIPAGVTDGSFFDPAAAELGTCGRPTFAGCSRPAGFRHTLASERAIGRENERNPNNVEGPETGLNRLQALGGSGVAADAAPPSEFVPTAGRPNAARLRVEFRLSAPTRMQWWAAVWLEPAGVDGRLPATGGELRQGPFVSPGASARTPTDGNAGKSLT